MIFQAHKGVSTENPENTMPAFEAAIEQGYKLIELDVGVTKDMHFVLLHDANINRTARHNDGGIIAEPVRIDEMTYEEVLEYDFGVWFAKKFKGTKIALLEDVLNLAQKNGILLKIDNKFQSFTEGQKKALFELIKPFEETACLTFNNAEKLIEAAEFFRDMHFHYDGIVTENILKSIRAVLPKERLTVWLPFECQKTAWVKVPFANEQFAALVKEYARLGLWILSRSSELSAAVKLGADVIETNGEIKPTLIEGVCADMHTHSESSHDSVCRIEDMCLSQIEKGTRIMAVTDHFDTASFDRYDIFTPIRNAYNTVGELNKKYGEKCLILSGVEISESFWYPDVYEKVMKLAEFDVIIGSVHLVKYKKMTSAYSGIDFSLIDMDEIYGFLDAYFNDVLTMVDFADFDILAHLTCPLRYIVGKYKIDIELSRYADKIETILKKIIKKGIALEVNTSSLVLTGDFMPSIEIIKKYYDLGGYLITLGSDAHIAGNASFGFVEAIETIKRIGFKNIYYYQKRKPYPIEI
ncbi:MAG: histidinol-phosphatase HisJ family protein [Ruminococcaceae bacterium]|nr:histidinol-phosphatase HisJ family protein [Oscillospiraceae bacterium]